MRAVTIERCGGPEVLAVTDRAPLSPGPGEALVDVEASGVNYVDVYHRIGQYPLPLPVTLGVEGAGTVAAVGDGVADVKPGDRVGWVMLPGSHAEQAVVPVDRLVPLPDGTSARTAAAALVHGFTAHFLTHNTYPVQAGDTVLVHAAAGGMGQLLTQLITHLGGRVIGTTSTPEKAKLAREAGAAAVVPYAEALDAVREATGGAGVPVVYDGVGKDTFETSMASLRRRGTLVLFGAASGPVPPFDPQRLQGAGSLFLTRPTLAHHIVGRDELLWRARDVLRWVEDGTLRIQITGTYPLERTRDAYEALESRRSTGKLLLVP